MGSVGKGNTKFRVFFFFFRTIFSLNCYYCMHLIVYDFKSSNVDFFSNLGEVGSFFGLIIEFENLGMMKLSVLNDLVEWAVGLGYGAGFGSN